MAHSVKDTADKAQAAASDALHGARDKASTAYEAARERVSAAGSVTAKSVDDYPVAALLGGLALGVAAGAFLPRTQAEVKALGPLGARLGDVAKAAAGAAREAGKGKLDELGLNKDSARDQVTKLAESALEAAKTAGTAAAGAVRK